MSVTDVIDDGKLFARSHQVAIPERVNAIKLHPYDHKLSACGFRE